MANSNWIGVEFMDWLQAIGLIVSNLVKLMQNANIWHGISWWDIVISIMAFSIAVPLFKRFYGMGGGSGKS